MGILEDVFQRVDREIWVVTAAAGPRQSGMVATWVSQASIDDTRPVVLLGAAPNHFTSVLIEQSGRFAAHLLKQDQAETALNFATGSGRTRDKFASVAHKKRTGAPPVLDPCLAWLDCEVFARLQTGDRTYYWAKPTGGATHGDDPPLCEKTLFAAANPEQLAALKQNRMEDASVLQPRHDAWRQSLPALLRPGSNS